MSKQEFDQELEDIKALLDTIDAREEESIAEEPLKKQKKSGGKALYYILLSLCAGTFLFCAIYIGNYFIQSQQQQDSMSNLQDLVNNNRPTISTTEPTPTPPEHTEPTEGYDPTENSTKPTEEPTVSTPTDPEHTEPTEPPTEPSTEPTEPTEPTILPEYQAVYALNNDLVGWINIPGTNIDYPVMQTPTRKDYYLYRNFDKEWSSWGSIYVREECDVFGPSDNVVIYGHRMKDKTMFYQLENNYTKKSFWQDHQYFTFDTLYEHHTYQIIAAFNVDVTANDFFAYHLYNDFANEEEFNQFMATVHSMQLYDTGLTAEYGDQLLTLSTCRNNTYYYNQRFVVVAKRIS